MAFANINWPDTGEMTRRIVIKLWEDQPDLYTFGLTADYSEPLTCWAKVQPVAGVLYWANQQIDNDITHIFYVRYYAKTKPEAIDGRHVIEWNGRRYRVKRTTNMEDAQRFTMIETTDLGAITATAYLATESDVAIATDTNQIITP